MTEHSEITEQTEKGRNFYASFCPIRYFRVFRTLSSDFGSL
jgi:hypothetical protein